MEKEVIISNDLSEIPHIVNFIKESGSSLQLSSDTIMRISLAIEEAVVNVINHASDNTERQEIRLRLNVSTDQLCFTLVDDGPPFNPLSKEEMWIALSCEQNFLEKLGLCLIRQIMDEVTYEYVNGNNLLTMKKNINIELKTERAMHINLCKIEEVTIITIEGRLDTVNSREFDLIVQPLMQEKTPSILINCENFSYISSSGIRSLILLQKSVMKNQGRLVLEAMRPEIRKIFDMTGCSSIFTIR